MVNLVNNSTDPLVKERCVKVCVLVGRKEEMSVSHASVHPVEDPPPPATEVLNPPRVRMDDIEGMPGTLLGLALRLFQFLFAAAALSVMASTSDFPSVTAFWYTIFY